LALLTNAKKKGGLVPPKSRNGKKKATPAAKGKKK
jgi:hypothetical protein